MSVAVDPVVDSGPGAMPSDFIPDQPRHESEDAQTAGENRVAQAETPGPLPLAAGPASLGRAKTVTVAAALAMR